jgi:hypothetical protein
MTPSICLLCIFFTSDFLQVEPETVATDSFMLNLQSVMLRFAEPFMDSKYTKA